MTKIAKLTESIRDRIHSGEWEVSQALPPRLLLSSEYGVAPGTISQALRNLEQEGLVRVLPRRGVIVTDTQSAAGDAQASGAIGLRGSYLRMGIPGKIMGYKGFLVNQLLDAAHEQEVPVLILQEHAGEKPMTRERCEALGVRGLIYLGGDSEKEAQRLCMEGFPVISAHRPPDRSPLNYIDCDHVALVRDVVDRYVALGHRRIAVIMPQTEVPGLLNKMKPYFIDSLYTHDLEYNVNPYWVTFEAGKTAEDWKKQIDALLDLENPPTAIFCWSCTVLDLLQACIVERGIRLPEDLSVTYTPCSDSAYPGISGYSYEGRDFGHKLLDGLMATIRNPFHFIQEELPFDFIDKGSVASAPSAGSSKV